MHRTAQALAAAGVAICTATAWTGAAAAAPSPHSDPHVVVATISTTGRVHLPHTIRPGYRDFRVSGAAGHALELVTAKRHGSVARLVADYRQFAWTGLPVSPERDFTFIGGALTGRSVYLHLRRGTYFAFDASGTTLDVAHIRTMHVSHCSRAARPPRVTATITAIGSNRWAPHPRSIPDTGYVKFVNAGHETQLINLLQLRPHTTLAEVAAVLADPNEDASTITTGRYAETGVISPGRSETASYTLPPGTYALISLWPDDRTGRPHAAEGMLRLITLT